MNRIKGKALEEAIQENPHCRQATLYASSICSCSFSDLSRKMKKTDPEEPYRRREHDEKSVLHWGQRKLFLSELEFLTKYAAPNDVVVYVGSAPGNHTFFLTLLFSFIHKFILIDPSPFYAQSTAKIEIIQDFFNDEHLQEIKRTYPSKRILFISDIRSASPLQEDAQTVERKVKQDMKMQMDWVLALKPRKSMLKFRLPWKKGNTDYLDGDIYYQAWGPPTTTETRLITSGKKIKSYSNEAYEQKMFYFNTRTRTNLYMHPIHYVQGLDHCYDCAAEVYIWKEYLKKYENIWNTVRRNIISIIEIRKNQKHAKKQMKPSNEEIAQMRELNTSRIRSVQTQTKTRKEMQDIIAIAIELTHSICSTRRTLTSKISHPKDRNWFDPLIFENGEIILLDKKNTQTSK